MEATAHARYVRSSPRKIDQLLMMVRGKSVSRALSVLQLVGKGSRPLVEKIIKSAFANAGKNENPETWYISSAWVGAGPQLKRMRAHAMGRGATIRHRLAHVTVVLSDQPKGKKKKRAIVQKNSEGK